jgi:N-acyl-D-aspartate/D-glutamate deacylase
MFGQAHCRDGSIIVSFKTKMPFDQLPEWKAIRSLPYDQQLHILADRTVRERLVAATKHGVYRRPVGAEARPPDYQSMAIFERATPPNRIVAEVAAERNVDPVDLIIDLALESGFDQLFIQLINHLKPEDVVAFMTHPRTVMTFSDSGAHVSQLVDFSIQTHLLAYWMREREAITLEQAVRMLTREPALAWGFTDRGLLREGFAADVNVFDPETVAPELPTVTNDLPGGAKRLTQRATGFLATLVGGQVTIRDGEHTGLLPGTLIRGPLAGT